MSIRLDLEASRNEAWTPTIELAYAGGDLPLEGATVRMQWRLYPGAPGAPIVAMAAIPFVDRPATSDDLASGFAEAGDRVLVLSPIVSAVEMASDDIPSGLVHPEPGEPDRFAQDAILTYGDGSTDTLFFGFLDLEMGVTRGA